LRKLKYAIYCKDIIPSILNEALKMLEASAVSLAVQLVFFLKFQLVIYSGTMIEQMWSVMRTSRPVQGTMSALVWRD
jgi:hypothetical protein